MRLVQRLRESEPPVPRQRVRARHDDGEPVAAPWARVQGTEVGGIPADTQRRVTLAYGGDQTGADALLDVDPDVAVARLLEKRGTSSASDSAIADAVARILT